MVHKSMAQWKATKGRSKYNNQMGSPQNNCTPPLLLGTHILPRHTPINKLHMAPIPWVTMVQQQTLQQYLLNYEPNIVREGDKWHYTTIILVSQTTMMIVHGQLMHGTWICKVYPQITNSPWQNKSRDSYVLFVPISKLRQQES